MGRGGTRVLHGGGGDGCLALPDRWLRPWARALDALALYIGALLAGIPASVSLPSLSARNSASFSPLSLRSSASLRLVSVLSLSPLRPCASAPLAAACTGARLRLVGWLEGAPDVLSFIASLTRATAPEPTRSSKGTYEYRCRCRPLQP